MRYLFHLGLFLGALGVVTSAEAQPNRRADREVTVVVAGHGHPKYDDSKHYSKHHSKHYGKHKAKKGVYRAPPGRAYGHYKGDYRYRLHDARRDLQQIVGISRAWRRATIIGDYYRQAMIDRRLTVWIERELYEARRDRYDHRYARQVRELSREIEALNRRFATGRARRHDYARKAQILDHLVELSERQVYLAEAHERHPRRPYAFR
ncbi:MAG: hypothetical protein OES69_10215 [Myxococcales bacterium]|nr:hypothetical protein [Myxococcales bacterium]MDH3844303.1 hypothetical protein [Myxococcales bacterium]